MILYRSRIMTPGAGFRCLLWMLLDNGAHTSSYSRFELRHILHNDFRCRILVSLMDAAGQRCLYLIGFRRVLHPREAEPKRRYGRLSGGQLCGRRPKEEEAAAAAEDAFHQPAAARTRGHFCQK
ncbi:hypothetical protein TNCV_2967151 [Trichonephila clavipes]|nr:hypothetical protein TNCV_2967151 [Trichonephila clavipes]